MFVGIVLAPSAISMSYCTTPARDQLMHRHEA
jgi:hypothetical protein